jgi:hypothetical protein
MGIIKLEDGGKMPWPKTGATKTALCASDAAEPPNFFQTIYIRNKPKYLIKNLNRF